LPFQTSPVIKQWFLILACRDVLGYGLPFRPGAAALRELIFHDECHDPA
jgi:hypothetical protein